MSALPKRESIYRLLDDAQRQVVLRFLELAQDDADLAGVYGRHHDDVGLLVTLILCRPGRDVSRRFADLELEATAERPEAAIAFDHQWLGRGEATEPLGVSLA